MFGGISCVLVIVFVITAFEPACGWENSCPSIDEYSGSEWRRWGNSCYRLTDRNEMYTGAKERCKSLGGEIAAPRSAEENEWFVTLAGNFSDLWIACKKDGKQSCLCNDQSQKYCNWNRDKHNDEQICASLCGARSKYCKTGEYGEWLPVTCNAPANNFSAVCIIRPSSQPKYCFPTGKNGQLVHESLANHTIRELTTPTVVGCGRACVDEPQCLSFNIKRDGQKLLCQLNNATRCDKPKDFLENCPNFSLYSDDIRVNTLP